MKNILIAFVLAAAPVVAYANCTTHSYMIDGRFVMCQTCCYNGNCQTNCF